MSKRKLIQLVNEKLVNGWDDPRMLTISGLRRRGVTASALRAFAYNIGITKYPSMTDMALLEHTMRDEFNRIAPRRLAVLRPIKVVLTNYPEGKTEELDAINNPEDPNAGTRKVPFSRELFIDRDDFMESPPPKYFRLRPNGEVRLKYAYIIKCGEVVKDSAGNVTELRCSVDLESKSGGATANRKVKGTIHWVSAAHALDAEVRLYDRLFTVPEPDSNSGILPDSSGGLPSLPNRSRQAGMPGLRDRLEACVTPPAAPGDFKSFINPNSLEVVNAKCEPALADARPGARYQFERLGYFALDPDSTPAKLATASPSGAGQIWNRTITLKDTWAKEAKGSARF
jgi:glutaminyl-tRNA synthetase